MNSVTVFLVSAVAFLSVMAVDVYSYLKLNEPLEIKPFSDRQLYTDFGVMKSARQCGGEGKFVKWRHELCISINPGPCVIPASQFLRGEMVFTPSDYSKSLGIRTILRSKTSGEELVAFQNAGINSQPVEPGQNHAVKAGVAFSSELRGKVVTVQLTVFRDIDQYVEVCSETDFLIL